jgi:taurine dioxygenase
MKITKLPDCDWGVVVNDLQIKEASEDEIQYIGHLLLNHQVVLLRNQELTTEEEVQVCYRFGDVEKVTAFNRCPTDQSGRSICEVQRVTGMLHPDGSPMGLFGHDHDLDWHANRPSAEMERKPIIWLRSIFGTKGSRTSWANCTLAYNDFDESFQRELDELYGIFGFEPNNYTSWNEWKAHRNHEGIKIVRSVPGLGGRVLFFPFLQLFGFKGKDEDYFRRTFDKIKNKILQEKYVYHHNWQDGDILLSEQWGTIHKRWECDVSQRLLHRISFGWDHITNKVGNEQSLSF